VTFPAWIHVGPWQLHPHVVFELLAYFAGFRLYLARRRVRGDHVGDAERWSLIAAAAIGAVIGSRLLFWLEDPLWLMNAIKASPGIAGGKTLVGALLGGWMAVELQKRRAGIRAPTGDLFAVPLAIGIAVGRLGCFLTGLSDGTYGSATSLPWGVDFGDAVARHPAAIYESLFMVALAAALQRVERDLPRGAAFKIFLIAYLSFRLVVDTLKPGLRIALGMTTIQWACVAGLGYYAWWLISLRKREELPAPAGQGS
jgi:phosphatidylglycerol---prolipoprotein diacylglyceryl transferase